MDAAGLEPAASCLQGARAAFNNCLEQEQIHGSAREDSMLSARRRDKMPAFDWRMGRCLQFEAIWIAFTSSPAWR